MSEENRVAQAVGNITKKHVSVLASSEDSWLSPFFGGNVPGPKRIVDKSIHPCADISRSVHACLDKNENKYEYCVPQVAKFELCLRETTDY